MENEGNKNTDNKRRNFLKVLFSAAAAAGLISTVKGNPIVGKPEKIKMLTPDGRLVEIEKCEIEKEITPKRASNVEVLDWMKEHKNKA
jgi:hypothetical protein